MATIKYKKITVVSIFKIAISQNTKCDILVGFQKLGHIMYMNQAFTVAIEFAISIQIMHTCIRLRVSRGDYLRFHTPVCSKLQNYMYSPRDCNIS